MSMTGKKHSDATKQKIRMALIGNQKLREAHKGAKAYNYKGEDVSYTGLHQWVRRWLGKPSLCEMCKSQNAKRYEWANISGQYKRDLTDWVRLCKKCHVRMDNVAQKTWKTRREKACL